MREYFPQLNGLRFFAVILTLIAHWCPYLGYGLIPFSWHGVDIFFVISGFLITNILLQEKAQERPILLTVRNFMLRRVLRLFPIYYIFLLFFIILYYFFNIHFWRPKLCPYLFTYTSNFYYGLGGTKDGIFNHTWSLAVEEQFYLVWPLLILILSSRYLLHLLILTIVTPFFIKFMHISNNWIELPTLINLHMLGAGSLMSYFYRKFNSSIFLKFINLHSKIIFFISLLLYIYHGHIFVSWKYVSIIEEFLLLISVYFLVLSTLIGWQGSAKYLFQNPVSVYLGKISYGIYLFHLPIPEFFSVLKLKMGYKIPVVPIVELIFFFIITIGLASLSFRFIEQPFLKLKLKFM